ncbi:MAG TPA: hypothetical protein VMV19_14385 [Xanthobacteraceae bacterium]|nr:hypothetical protein [Xanthobacteraceae bacterium]
MMPVSAVLVLVVSMRHRHAAFLAQLRAFGDHAFGYFRHVRNEIGTKPHRVGRTCMPLLRSALSGGGVETDQQQTSRQRQPEEKTHTHIGKFPKFFGLIVASNLAVKRGGVDGADAATGCGAQTFSD